MYKQSKTYLFLLRKNNQWPRRCKSETKINLRKRGGELKIWDVSDWRLLRWQEIIDWTIRKKKRNNCNQRWEWELKNWNSRKHGNSKANNEKTKSFSPSKYFFCFQIFRDDNDNFFRHPEEHHRRNHTTILERSHRHRLDNKFFYVKIQPAIDEREIDISA